MTSASYLCADVCCGSGNKTTTMSVWMCMSHFSEEFVLNPATDTNEDFLSFQELLHITHHLYAPGPAAVLHTETGQQHIQSSAEGHTRAGVCGIECCCSPRCRSAACPQGGGVVRPSACPSAGPDHSAHCSSPQ